jgi:hypothetical protein
MDPTIVSTGTGSIAIAYDYSGYLERIATALETIAGSSTSTNERLVVAVEKINESLEKIVEVTTGTGIRTYGAYDWIKPLEMISWHGQGLGPMSVSTASISQLVTVINSLTNNVSKFE